MKLKVRAARARAVKKKKIEKILSKKKLLFLYIFILKSNEEQETGQLDMNMAVAEEYIEYYTDKLIKKHKYSMPLCTHIDKSELNNVIETTSNIPAGYYITAECIKDVETFAQKMHKKFDDKDPFSMDKVVVKIFLHDLEHFLIDIYHTYFFIEDVTSINIKCFIILIWNFFMTQMIFVHMNLCLDCTFFILYSKTNMIYEVCF